jgi:hypothetical protein
MSLELSSSPLLDRTHTPNPGDRLDAPHSNYVSHGGILYDIRKMGTV